MQYILIVSKEVAIVRTGDSKYGFKYFDTPHDLINYVSNLSKGDSKVHKIVILDYTGKTTEMTIGFNEGHLDLVKLENVHEEMEPLRLG